ncbi:MAG: hypothetical protein ACTSRU_07760 [Candidatus Hodarchaeales archaeon]
MAKIALLSFLSEINPQEEVREKIRLIIESLRDEIKPHEVIEEIEQGAISAVFAIIGTGGTENKAIAVLSRVPKRVRIFLVAFPNNNSLPAALELKAEIDNRMGVSVSVLTDPKGRVVGLHRQILRRAKQAIRFEKFLHSRIGLIGLPSDWLIASTVDTQVIKRWGMEPLPISVEKVIEVFDNVKLEDIAAAKEKIAGVHSIVASGEVEKSLKMYIALTRLKDEFKLDAMTIRCFDILLNKKISACLSLAILTSEGIISGCEGDLPSLLTMMFLNTVTGKTPFMANVSNVNGNELLLAHCTISMDMCESYDLMTHFESGLSVAVRGRIARGEQVVIGRIGGKNLDRAQWFKGTVVKNVEGDELCRTAIKIILTDPYPNLLEEALANHYVLIKSNSLEEIQSYWKWFSQVSSVSKN